MCVIAFVFVWGFFLTSFSMSVFSNVHDFWPTPDAAEEWWPGSELFLSFWPKRPSGSLSQFSWLWPRRLSQGWKPKYATKGKHQVNMKSICCHVSVMCVIWITSHSRNRFSLFYSFVFCLWLYIIVCCEVRCHSCHSSALKNRFIRFHHLFLHMLVLYKITTPTLFLKWNVSCDEIIRSRGPDL